MDEEKSFNLIVTDGETFDSATNHATWTSNERTIRIYGESSVGSIYLDDIVDVKTSKNHDLKFVVYPLIGNERRRRVFEVDCTEADEFKETLLHKLRPPTPPHRPSQSSIDSRRIIVIANSVSGVKNAITSWKRIVQPIFDECRVSYEFKQTERANHAVEIMQKLDINNFTAVCVMSGDGVVTEVIRGLLTRSDRDRALRFPILHIPCGTSNALAAAMAFKSGEPFSPRGNFCKELALFIAHPVYCSLSLQHVETESNGHWPMFMTAAYGLIADIDLGSERFRWAGLARLHIEAFIRIARLPTLARYRVRISYKPVEDKQILRRTLMKTRDIWQKLGSEHFTSGNVEIVDDTTKKLQNDSVRLVEEAFVGTHLNDTPTLADSIPKDWITIEGDFAFVCLCSLSHIGSDLPYIPSARLEEETFYLTLVDWRTLKTRFHMAHLLLTVDRCAHLEHSSLHMIPVTACRVEPQSQNGYSAIDGEPFKSASAFQVTSTSLKATVIAREPVNKKDSK
ncbi:DAGKc domain-containing protein [Aphelenchoides besseyi]|nr:DAGKc domain-containing protein [Aphelenchoides besseyi]